MAGLYIPGYCWALFIIHVDYYIIIISMYLERLTMQNGETGSTARNTCKYQNGDNYFSSKFSNEKSREYQRWRSSGQLAPDPLTGQSFSRGAQERISSISVFIGVCGHPFKSKL